MFQAQPSIKDHWMWSKLSMSISIKLSQVHPDVLAVERSQLGDAGWPRIVVRCGAVWHDSTRPLIFWRDTETVFFFFFFAKPSRHMCFQLWDCTNNERTKYINNNKKNAHITLSTNAGWKALHHHWCASEWSKCLLSFFPFNERIMNLTSHSQSDRQGF